MNSFTKILCPIDLSENSKAAIALASSLAKLAAAKLIFVHVGPPPLPREVSFAAGELEALMARHQEQLSEINATESGIDVHHVILQGDAAEEVLKYAEEEMCDLIVLSTHGRSGITRLLMGSVAESIVRHSKIPVLSVRYPDGTIKESE